MEDHSYSDPDPVNQRQSQTQIDSDSAILSQPSASPVQTIQTPAPTTTTTTATKTVNTSAAIDATLRFFANASNETLGACVVGLCASTYLVLGRFGLVLIGAVGGVVLH